MDMASPESFYNITTDDPSGWPLSQGTRPVLYCTYMGIDMFMEKENEPTKGRGTARFPHHSNWIHDTCITRHASKPIPSLQRKPAKPSLEFLKKFPELLEIRRPQTRHRVPPGRRLNNPHAHGHALNEANTK